ncbi:hypothetical protein ACTXT7_008325 [Hymenolepis weldensis]
MEKCIYRKFPNKLTSSSFRFISDDNTKKYRRDDSENKSVLHNNRNVVDILDLPNESIHFAESKNMLSKQ